MSTFGEELKRERELREITLREISDATKINLRYLDALERNDFEHLPGGVFNKGFVRAYAQFIGVDPDAMVNAYLLEEQAQQGADSEADGQMLRLAPGTGPIKLSRPDAAGPDASDRPPSRTPLIVLLSVAAVAAIALFVWRPWTSSAPAADPQPTGRTEAGPTTGQATPTATTPRPSSRGAERPEGASSPPNDPSAPDRRSGPAPGPVSSAAAAVEPAGSTPRPPSSGARAAPSEDHRVASDAGDGPKRGSPSTDSTAGDPRVIRAQVILDRLTSGRLNCDNRRVEILDGLPAGTVLDMECRRFLLLEAEDGGGLRVGLSGERPVSLVADGVPLKGYRIVPPTRGTTERGQGARS